jgi:hypothetical protein
MQTEANKSLNQSIKPIRESSVFSDIQKSVQNKDQSAFSLLLAMVTQDKMELDAFHLPVNKVPKSKSDLEKTFNVVPQTLIGKVNNEQDLLFNQLIHSKNKEDVKLLLQLQPQPLITRSDDSSNSINLPAQLINSLGINQKAKLYQDIQSKQQMSDVNVMSTLKEVDSLITKPNNDMEMDIDSWFSVLEQARTLSKVA